MDKKEMKRREKALKKFYKMLKLPRKASQEEIDIAIVQYVENGGDLKKIILTKEQLNNVDFMSALYVANPEAADIFKPSEEKLNDKLFMSLIYLAAPEVTQKILPGEELRKDKEFMLMYADAVAVAIKANPFSEEAYQKRLLGVYIYVIEDMDFINKIAEKYPDTDFTNLVTNVLYDSLRDGHRDLVTPGRKKEIEKKILKNFPKEYWVEYVKKNGFKIIFHNLPEKEEKELLEVAIERDGFKTIKVHIPKEELLENKDLILKAAKKEGLEALEQFLLEFLDPREKMNVGYEGPGDPYLPPETYVYVFNEKKAAIQKALLNDPDIVDFIETEKSKRLKNSFNQKKAGVQQNEKC